MPGPLDDLSARLSSALQKSSAAARSTASAAGQTSRIMTLPKATGTPQSDEFNDRLSQALSRARSDQPVGAEAAAASGAPRTGPVGQGEYVVRQGDCMASIAVDTGHFWETIWTDAANSELKEARKDPYVLLPEDRVTIPELQRKDESIAPEMRHRFRRKGCPEKLIVHFREGGNPRANQRYVLVIDRKETEGVTDPNGRVEIFIPPDAKRGMVYFPDAEDAYELDLGHLDPVSETSGIQGRLRNLGYYGGPVDGKATPELEDGIRSFQTKHKMNVTGRLDPDGRRKLQDIHGS